MDKRYGLILIIIVACCINLIVISNSSDVIGSASVECGDFIFSLPSEFSLYDSEKNHVLVHDSKYGMNIDVYSNLHESDTYDNKIKGILNDGFTIVSNGTINTGGIEVHSIFYKKDNDNRSAFFFEKDGNRFRILVRDFDMDNNRNKTIDYAVEIIESIVYNYKL